MVGARLVGQRERAGRVAEAAWALFRSQGYFAGNAFTVVGGALEGLGRRPVTAKRTLTVEITSVFDKALRWVAANQPSDVPAHNRRSPAAGQERLTVLASGARIGPMSYVVDFTDVTTEGVESSPVAAALAGLRANEARYFKNKYDHVFTVEPAGDAQGTVDWVHGILKEERDIVISSPPLEATAFEVDGIRMAYVFYESGLSINVMYTIDDAGKRAVGFKLSDGMEIPPELAEKFKFARQRSKLAGTIRGSYFTIKNEH
jgi:hypothetical protein